MVLVSGCTTRPIAPDSVPKSGDAPDVEIELADGTVVRMDGARPFDGAFCGEPVQCRGRSCEAIHAARCVAKDQVVSMSAREVNQPAVAGVIIGGLAVAAIVTAVAVSSGGGNSKNTSRNDSSNSGGYGVGSCPRVYSWNSKGWELDSGTFGLSYFAAAPRTDFDRLDHLEPDHGKYRFRLVNEQDETEHTDLVRLHVVDHPSGTRVVPTAAGKLLTFRDERLPATATDFRGRDVRDLIAKQDNREWTSDLRDRHLTHAEDARDGLRLVFAKPPDAKTAKLRLAAHNTDWAGKMLGYLLAHRGSTLPAWWERMNADAGARGRLEAFLIREGMLRIRVKTSAGWAARGIFWAAGSEIVKEEAFELGVADVPGDTLEVELESALDFWSVDAATVAYGDDEPTVVHDLAPAAARTNRGRDVTSLLSRSDAQRFDTVNGDVAELEFAVPAPVTGATRSFVLETNGYYVPHIEPAADADPAAMDALLDTPFAASRLALAFRLALAPE